jgi:hypothetical protein
VVVVAAAAVVEEEEMYPSVMILRDMPTPCRAACLFKIFD